MRVTGAYALDNKHRFGLFAVGGPQNLAVSWSGSVYHALKLQAGDDVGIASAAYSP